MVLSTVRVLFLLTTASLSLFATAFVSGGAAPPVGNSVSFSAWGLAINDSGVLEFLAYNLVADLSTVGPVREGRADFLSDYSPDGSFVSGGASATVYVGEYSRGCGLIGVSCFLEGTQVPFTLGVDFPFGVEGALRTSLQLRSDVGFQSRITLKLYELDGATPVPILLAGETPEPSSLVMIAGAALIHGCYLLLTRGKHRIASR